MPGPRVCTPGDLDLAALGMVIVLGRTPDDIRLLRRAVDAGVPTLTTHGGVRSLVRALQEGALDLFPLPANHA